MWHYKSMCWLLNEARPPAELTRLAAGSIWWVRHPARWLVLGHPISVCGMMMMTKFATDDDLESQGRATPPRLSYAKPITTSIGLGDMQYITYAYGLPDEKRLASSSRHHSATLSVVLYKTSGKTKLTCMDGTRWCAHIAVACMPSCPPHHTSWIFKRGCGQGGAYKTENRYCSIVTISLIKKLSQELFKNRCRTTWSLRSILPSVSQARQAARPHFVISTLICSAKLDSWSWSLLWPFYHCSLLEAPCRSDNTAVYSRSESVVVTRTSLAYWAHTNN